MRLHDSFIYLVFALSTNFDPTSHFQTLYLEPEQDKLIRYDNTADNGRDKCFTRTVLDVGTSF